MQPQSHRKRVLPLLFLVALLLLSTPLPVSAKKKASGKKKPKANIKSDDYYKVLVRSYSARRSFAASNLTTKYSRSSFSSQGLKRSASQKEIKKAYRKLALEYHPDKVRRRRRRRRSSSCQPQPPYLNILRFYFQRTPMTPLRTISSWRFPRRTILSETRR